MLTNLYIKDFILIDELNIDFNNDFSVFTGETGAGKSIFIDCIACLIGDKLNVSMIRKNANKAIIEVQFEMNPILAEKLSEAGYDPESFIVTREIHRDGKSITRLNQRNCTVSFIKDCLSRFVDIHCQHDNQYLLNDKYHLRLLDQYCGIDQQLQQLKVLYEQYHHLENEYDHLLNTTYNQAQIEMIQYQLKELTSLEITDILEDEKISEQLSEIAAVEKNQKALEQIKDLFEKGILDHLYQFTKLANSLSHFESIKENVDHIIDAYYSLTDDYETIMDKTKNLTLDAQTIDELNQRLYTLQKSKRKYGKDLQGLLDLQQQLQQQLDQYDQREFILSKLEKDKQKAYQAYLHQAQQVSQIRQEKAQQLAQAVLKQIKDLSLEKARFEIQFTSSKPTVTGIDEVVFMGAMNTGSNLQPLHKVASGGELARLMLGLKVIFAKLNGTRLIIFDEIDTGVSGPVALSIGVKMAQLSKDMQVFAVTHLPSVAACGHSHYYISKTQANEQTNSKVEKLSTEQRIEQLALIANAKVTESSLSAASELYQRAQQLVKEVLC